MDFNQRSWIRISGGPLNDPSLVVRRHLSFFRTTTVCLSFHQTRGGVKGGGGGGHSLRFRRAARISYPMTAPAILFFLSFLHNRERERDMEQVGEDEEFPFILPRFDSDLPVLNYRAKREREREREREPGLVSSQKNLNT